MGWFSKEYWWVDFLKHDFSTALEGTEVFPKEHYLERSLQKQRLSMRAWNPLFLSGISRNILFTDKKFKEPDIQREPTRMCNTTTCPDKHPKSVKPGMQKAWKNWLEHARQWQQYEKETKFTEKGKIPIFSGSRRHSKSIENKLLNKKYVRKWCRLLC